MDFKDRPRGDGVTKWSLLKGEGSDEATVAAVLGKRGEPVVQALLVNAAGIHIEEESGRSGYFTPGVYVCVPERFASTITTRPYNLPIDELLWWVIPQLEYNATPRCVRALQDAYSTQWSFEKLLGE